MDKSKIHNLISIVEDYGGLIVVSDLGIKVQGSLLTHIFYKEEYDTLQFFAGDMVNDKDAEEVFPNEEEMETIFAEITDNF